MQNYRQFYGEHHLTFSHDIKKNVTVIHGENGSGKTTLLNAFKWCFYGNTDFDTGNANILNEQAIALASVEEDIILKITVEFEHEDRTYSAERTQIFYKQKVDHIAQIGSENMSLWINDGSGEKRKSDSPETHLNQILPENMHPYFFFNGERIEKLASASQSIKIQQAIKNLMGLEIVERASQHLGKNVKRYFNKKMRSNASEDLSKVIDGENDLEDKLEDLKKLREQAIKNKAAHEENLIHVEEQLRNIEDSSRSQKKRDELSKKLDKYKDDKIEIFKQRKKFISKNAFLVFAKEVFHKSDTILEENRAKGELPYKIKEQFIDDLLENNECICGREIANDSPEYNKIFSYRKKAGNIELENEFLFTSSAIKQQSKERKEFKKKFSLFQSDIEQLDKDIEYTASQLDEIGYKLKNNNHEDVADLEKKREELDNTIKDEIGKTYHYDEEVKTCKKTLKNFAEQRVQLEKQSEKCSEYARHRGVVDTLQEAIDALYDSLSNQVRVELSEKVNQTFKEIIRKSYSAEIDDSYCLQIYKDGFNNDRQKVYEKSTGENQITSLSFIGSIINQAKERYEQETSSAFYKGGLFPLVMDSPFGALDDDYRKKIAHHIPKLAEQVIIMVSNSQWSGVVEEQCNPKVGKQWSLIYHSPSITLEEEDHYVKSSNKFEYTDIREV